MLKRIHVFKFIAVFFAFLAVAGFANAQEYANTLRLTRADGMQIELKQKTTNRAGTAFYLYNEIGYSNPNTKLQDMYAASVILGLGSPNNITDDNRSRIMNEPSTGRNYKVSLPTLGELRNLRNVYGDRPNQWSGNLDGNSEFWTSTKATSGMHKILNLANDQDNNRWDWDMRVLALTVQEEVSDDRVCFYENANYQGKSRCFDKGNYTNLGDYPSQGGPATRTFSSAKLGDNCHWAEVHGSERMNGFSRSVDDLYIMNDQAVAVVVKCSEILSPIQNQDVLNQDPYSVCFFERPNFLGKSKCFSHGKRRWVGNYADGSNANDTFRSFSFGSGCASGFTSYFYADGDFQGNVYRILLGPDSSNRRVSTMPDGWNNRISSLRIDCQRP